MILVITARVPSEPINQLGQVIAGGAFDELSSRLYYFSGRQHCFQPQDRMSGYPVFHGSHSTGIGGDIPTDSGAGLTGIEGVIKSVLLHSLIKSRKSNPRLNSSHKIILVYLQDSIHPL